MPRKENVSPSELYDTEWFLKELAEVQKNPVTSGLVSGFNRYLAEVREGKWGQKEKWIAKSLLRDGMAEEQIQTIPDLLEIARVKPLSLEPSFVGFMERLRKKVVNKQGFSQDELQLASNLLLVGVPDEAEIKIWNGVLSSKEIPSGLEVLRTIAEIEIGRTQIKGDDLLKKS